MSKYCRNCGKKLKRYAIKCGECNTYIADLKKEIMKRIFLVLFVIIILVIVVQTIRYNIHYDNLSKSLYNKYLSADYKDAEYVKHESCYSCVSFFKESCFIYQKRDDCFRYYYKSKPDLSEPDIVIYYNKGTVSKDLYSTVINRYGGEEFHNEKELESLIKRRNSLKIYFKKLDTSNINDVYNMVNEIVDLNNKDGNEALNITIDYNCSKAKLKRNSFAYCDAILIRYRQEFNSDNYVLEWFKDDDHPLVNPSLDQVVNRFNEKNDNHN